MAHKFSQLEAEEAVARQRATYQRLAETATVPREVAFFRLMARIQPELALWAMLDAEKLTGGEMVQVMRQSVAAQIVSFIANTNVPPDTEGLVAIAILDNIGAVIENMRGGMQVEAKVGKVN